MNFIKMLRIRPETDDGCVRCCCCVTDARTDGWKYRMITFSIDPINTGLSWRFWWKHCDSSRLASVFHSSAPVFIYFHWPLRIEQRWFTGFIQRGIDFCLRLLWWKIGEKSWALSLTDWLMLSVPWPSPFVSLYVFTSYCIPVYFSRWDLPFGRHLPLCRDLCVTSSGGRREITRGGTAVMYTTDSCVF